MVGATLIHDSQQRLVPCPVIQSFIRSDVMPTQAKDIETVIPDLRNIPLDRRAELGSSALAQTIDRYREWLRENGIPLSSFQVRI
jgi:hypothetical protein